MLNMPRYKPDEDDLYVPEDDYVPEFQCRYERVAFGTVVMETIATNEDCRRYNFKVPIEGFYSWKRGIGISSLDTSNEGHPTLEDLTQIAGVESLLLAEAYCIWVKKGVAFTWEDIQPKVVKILQSHNSIYEI